MLWYFNVIDKILKCYNMNNLVFKLFLYLCVVSYFFFVNIKENKVINCVNFFWWVYCILYFLGFRIYYEVYVYMGNKFGVGIDVWVFIILFGEKGWLKEIEFESKGWNDFEKG